MEDEQQLMHFGIFVLFKKERLSYCRGKNNSIVSRVLDYIYPLSRQISMYMLYSQNPYHSLCHLS